MKILLVVYDNGSYVSFFPQGLAYISSVMREEGNEIKIYNQDVNHYSDEHLTEYLNNNLFDIVGISVIGGYYQYRKLLSLCKAINKSKNRPKYLILGGHGPAPEPEYFLKKTKADIIVIGEGEETIKELLTSIKMNLSFENIKGIAYRIKNNYFVNPRRDLISDIDTIPFPDYNNFPIDHYKLIRFVKSKVNDFCMPMLSGRGCVYNCNFCFRLDRGFRPRKIEKILEEIELLKSKWGINNVYFTDELLMSSKKRTIEVCEGIIKSKIKIKWSCNGRLNFATDEVLKIMKEAGCDRINYGIESFDDKILKVMNKKLTTKTIVRGIENTLKYGLTPGLNIIFGNIGETKEILKKGVEFLLKYSDHEELRTIRPVTPYPGSPLYYYAIQNGFLKDIEDFYENKHVNSDLLSINFTDMTNEEFHKNLYEANKILLEDYYDYKKKEIDNTMKELYFSNNTDFRGYRDV